jgi:hypothetical protein
LRVGSLRSLSFKFVFESLLLFSLFSFLLYAMGISPFYFPHFALIMTLLYPEKNKKKRYFYIVLATLLYSQIAAPLPFVFLVVSALQIYILTASFFSATAFDYPLTALFNCIGALVILNFNKFVYIYIFTGEIRPFYTAFQFGSSVLIMILIFVLFKSYFNRLFAKDTWL